MKYLKIAFIFGLVLMISAGCSKEEIQPDPLNETEEAVLKGAKEKKDKDHYVPFKASFDTKSLIPPFQDEETGLWTYKIGLIGHATHLGKTSGVIDQWWLRLSTKPDFPGGDPFLPFYMDDSYPDNSWGIGEGDLVFTAANGDELWASYSAFAFHPDNTKVHIHYVATFTGGTGRFIDAEGSFTWTGLFYKTPPNAGGVATAVGKIKY